MTTLRLLVVAAALAICSEAGAQEPPEPGPLLSIEARAGQGISLGGGQGNSTIRMSPLNLEVMVEHAIRVEPWTTLVGSAFVETGNRAGIGGRLGVRIHADVYRFGALATVIASPYTLGGATATAGRCWTLLCGDVQGSLFVLGSDLPDGRVAAQLQLVGSVRFDAL